jgi:alpha-2-macroglobulin
MSKARRANTAVVRAAASGRPARPEGRDKVQLRAKQRGGAFPCEVSTAGGPRDHPCNVTGPGGFALERNMRSNVRPATQILTRRTVRQIAKGESITLSADLFADLVPGTGSVALSVGPSTALDAAAILKALDRYPFGCSEQIAAARCRCSMSTISRAPPSSRSTPRSTSASATIERLLARQASMARSGSGRPAATTLARRLRDRLPDPRARAQVRGAGCRPSSSRSTGCATIVAVAPEIPKDGGRKLAYALYVLARNGMAPVGDLRYLADAKLAALATPIAKAQIAAALGLIGDRTAPSASTRRR